MKQTLTKANLDDPITQHLRNDIARLHVGQTVGEALARVRSSPPEGRIIYFYVVDDNNRLKGVVPTRRLLLSPPETTIDQIMVKRVVTIPETATVLDACEFFTMHKLLAFPVVDSEKHLLGIVDIELYTDEIADLAQPADYDQMFQLVGVHAAAARMGTPWDAFQARFPWLLCNIGGGILAAFLTSVYQDVLDTLIVLALFIPVVLALSESVGIQSVSLALQAVHTGRLTWSGVAGTLRRELATGALLGIGSGPLVGLVAWFWKGQGLVGITLLSSIGLAMTASALVGMALPILLVLMKLDPRVAAGPVTLVLADLITLTTYFNLARWMLM